MKNVLITGGAGFIGTRLGASLAGSGYRVTILDNLSPQVHGPNPAWTQPPHVARFIRGDVRSREHWTAALADQQIVVHLAAETGTGQSMYQIQNYVDVNVRGTAIMLDALANEAHAVRKLVVASSRAIYGEGKYLCSEHGAVYPESRRTADMQAGDFHVKCPHCGGAVELTATDEDSRLQPSSVYGISKLTQEQLCMTTGRALGIPTVALRYQNVYGPGQSLQNPYTGIISIFSTRLRHGAPVVVFEDGHESRDFVFIDDAIDATVRAVESATADDGVFNVGSGVATEVLTVANVLRTALSATSPVRVSGEFRIGDIRANLADVARARAQLGFRPRVDFGSGIRSFAQWAASQAMPEDHLDSSIEEMRRKGLLK